MSATAKNLRDAYEVIRTLTRLNERKRNIEIVSLDDPDFDLGSVACDFYATIRKAHHETAR